MRRLYFQSGITESVLGCQLCHTCRQNTFGFLTEKMVYAFPENGLQIGRGQQLRIKHLQATVGKAETHRLQARIGQGLRYKSQRVQRPPRFYCRNKRRTFLQTLLPGFYFLCVLGHKLLRNRQPHPQGHRHTDMRRTDADTHRTGTRTVYVLHFFHSRKDN